MNLTSQSCVSDSQRRTICRMLHGHSSMSYLSYREDRVEGAFYSWKERCPTRLIAAASQSVHQACGGGHVQNFSQNLWQTQNVCVCPQNKLAHICISYVTVQGALRRSCHSMATSHAAGCTATSSTAACCGLSICCRRALATSSLDVPSSLQIGSRCQTCSGPHFPDVARPTDAHRLNSASSPLNIHRNRILIFTNAQLYKSVARPDLQHRSVCLNAQEHLFHEMLSCPVHLTVEAPENGTELFDNVTQVAARLGLAVEAMSCSWRGAHLHFRRLL